MLTQVWQLLVLNLDTRGLCTYFAAWIGPVFNSSSAQNPFLWYLNFFLSITKIIWVIFYSLLFFWLESYTCGFMKLRQAIPISLHGWVHSVFSSPSSNVTSSERTSLGLISKVSPTTQYLPHYSASFLQGTENTLSSCCCSFVCVTSNGNVSYMRSGALFVSLNPQNLA